MDLNCGVNQVDIIAPGIIDIGNYGYEDDSTEPCKWAVLCWERHLRDLKRAVEDPENFPYYFCERSALVSLRFFDFLQLSKGKWAGKPVELLKWQKMIMWILFGWKKLENDARRFTMSYIEVPRKNGKSSWIAGLNLYLGFVDGESGAEAYTVANSLKQAKIVFNESRIMALNCPLLQHLKVLTNNVSCAETWSKMEALSTDYGSHDGLNINSAVIDELHSMRGVAAQALIDVILTARGAREQPMVFQITTAGLYKDTYCYSVHQKAKKVLEQVFDDETYFFYIATINEDQDWRLLETWKTANPSYGITLNASNFEEEARNAEQMPRQLESFLRLRLNVWTDSATQWLPTDLWKNCGQLEIDWSELEGASCYAALDLSSTIDTTALALVFPIYDIDPRTKKKRLVEAICKVDLFIPGENAQERDRLDSVPFTMWIRQGYVHATPGNVIDHEYIKFHLKKYLEIYDIKEIAFDRWNATALMQEIAQGGAECVGFGQGFKDMSDGCKKLEMMMKSEKLYHENNPCLNWMASNAVIEQDAAENIKVNKRKSTERVDGIVALVMALRRAELSCYEEKSGSVYESREMKVI